MGRKCSGPRIFGAVCHFLAFAGFVTFIAGWAIDLGYFNQLAELVVKETGDAVNGNASDGQNLQSAAEDAGQQLGDDFLSAMTDHNSAGFTNYIFIASGILALLIKLIQSCWKNRWMGLVCILVLSASIAMAGFIAGPMGSAFITCMTSSDNSDLTATEKQLADCVAGENNLNIALQFFGSTIYIICITLVICMMFFEAQTNLNKIAPMDRATAKEHEVWA